MTNPPADARPSTLLAEFLAADKEDCRRIDTLQRKNNAAVAAVVTEALRDFYPDFPPGAELVWVHDD